MEEDIPNPKSELRKLYPDFDEIEDGGKILGLLDVEHVLSNPDTCVWLRTLFAWCVKALEQYPHYETLTLPEYQLHDEKLQSITVEQIDNLNWSIP